MKPIPFWSDEIRIRVTESSERDAVGRTVMLRHFVGDQLASLWELETGEIECRSAGRFVKGESV